MIFGKDTGQSGRKIALSNKRTWSSHTNGENGSASRTAPLLSLSHNNEYNYRVIMYLTKNKLRNQGQGPYTATICVANSG